jgi:hypothetical protein
MWGRKENKLYSLIHFSARQHTLKEYGINFYAHKLLKRNGKFDFENNMLESFGKRTKIARMSAGFWKHIFTQFLKHIYSVGMDIEQAFSYWRNLAKKRNSKF